MNILVIHAWLRGNVGDILHGAVLLRLLRSLQPDRLDLCGYPSQPPRPCRALTDLADRYIGRSFAWWWHFLPSCTHSPALETLRRGPIARLFGTYDVVVSMPGPFLSRHDARLNASLFDISLARDAGARFVLAGHSIGPLPDYAVPYLKRVNLCVAREPETARYLRGLGIEPVRAADYGFVYASELMSHPLPNPLPCNGPTAAIFLRSDRLDPGRIGIKGGRLTCGGKVLADYTGCRPVLATSDPARDGKPLGRLSRRLNIPFVAASTPRELFGLVDNCRHVVSDRYHPLVCAAALGTRTTVLTDGTKHKMLGLRELLEQGDPVQLHRKARNGLDAVRRCFTTPASERSRPAARGAKP
mgnify:CR=1 FL=1